MKLYLLRLYNPRVVMDASLFHHARCCDVASLFIAFGPASHKAGPILLSEEPIEKLVMIDFPRFRACKGYLVISP